MDDEFKVDTTLDGPVKTPKRRFAKPPRKFVAIVITIIIASVAGWYVFLRPSVPSNAPTNTVSNEQVEKADTTTQKDSVRLIATGDMIPHDAINAQAKQADGTYQYASMFGDTKKWFERADIRFCNQPTLAGGTKFGVTGYPDFNSPLEFTSTLQSVGCNLINVGSNHTNDKNQAVINATLDGWQDQPNVLAVAGANRSNAEKQTVQYFEMSGIKFAYVSYTTYTNKPSPNGYSVTMYSDVLAEKQLAEAKSKADIILVSMRWGTEYSPTVTSYQRETAAKLSSLGADIIVGHGTHVLQAAEKINDTVVWYGLGNYFNAQIEPEGLFNGIAAMDISTTTKKVSIAGYLPIYMHYEWTADQKKREDLMARKNFSMFTLNNASDPLVKSQLNTTVDAQNSRIQSTLNKLTTVKLLSEDEYLR